MDNIFIYSITLLLNAIFTARQHIACNAECYTSYRKSVRPSVCLSVRQHMQCSVKYTISERDEKDVCRLADALSLCGS